MIANKRTSGVTNKRESISENSYSKQQQHRRASSINQEFWWDDCKRSSGSNDNQQTNKSSHQQERKHFKDTRESRLWSHPKDINDWDRKEGGLRESSAKREGSEWESSERARGACHLSFLPQLKIVVSNDQREPTTSYRWTGWAKK